MLDTYSLNLNFSKKKLYLILTIGIPPYVKLDKAKLCPKGTEITSEKECNEALKYASDLEIIFPPFSWTKVSIGSWGQLPYQCSYRAGGDNTFFFNRKKVKNAKLFLSGMHKMICKQC